jgi:CheY-like chemotaxis protein
MAEKKRARILVVSDDEESGTIAQEILTSRGYAVGRVTNADATAERLNVGAPDLVVLDMFAPVIEAWPILDDVGRLAQPPAVVALTGRCLSASALGVLRQHIRGQLSKPFAPDALTDMCARVLAPDAEPRSAEPERRQKPRTTFVGEATLLTTKGRPVCSRFGTERERRPAGGGPVAVDVLQGRRPHAPDAHPAAVVRDAHAGRADRVARGPAHGSELPA